MKIAEGWSYSLQESDCLKALPDVDLDLLRSVLSRLGEQLKDGVWCLDRNLVAQNAARLLLRAEAPHHLWSLDSFLPMRSARTPNSKDYAPRMRDLRVNPLTNLSLVTIMLL